ncbi:hypothetical protein TURU_009302 [Turdus rufiventris]|nr:hypothetical protein TURU_009302 [Turdus rufiventris]
MPSSSAAAAPSAAEMPRLPPHPLLQRHISGLGFRDHGLPAGGSGVVGVARQRAGLAPPPDSFGEPRLGGAGEAAARGEGDLKLEEEEDEEDHLAALLLLSTSSSLSQPLPLLPALGSVLFSPALDEKEAAAGAHDPEGVMAAMLSHGYGSSLSGGGAVGLSGERTALLRGKSVNTTECVPVPSSEHVAEIVGRQAWIALTQVQDLVLSPVEPHEIAMGPLLELVQVPLDGIPSFMSVNSTTQLGVICKFAEGALNPFVYVLNKDMNCPPGLVDGVREQNGPPVIQEEAENC